MSKIMKITINHTKNEVVQTFVWHEFIDQNLLFFLHAVTHEAHKISMLKFGNQ